MLYRVGAGICEGHITEVGKKIIEEAEIIYGSRRALKLVGKYINGEKIILKSFDEEIRKEIEKEAEDKNVVVVSTGDPLVSGLGTLFNGETVPGISSVQVALARLRIDLCDVLVVDAHAKKFELKNRHLLILADKNFDVNILGNREVIILENLCEKDERIIYGFADEIKLRSNYSIIFVKEGCKCERV